MHSRDYAQVCKLDTLKALLSPTRSLTYPEVKPPVEKGCGESFADYTYISVIIGEGMSDTELLETVKRIEASTRALVMLLAQQAQSADPKAKAEQQSIEAVLFLSGFTQADVGKLLNKSRQSVGQRLKSEGVA